MWSTYIFMLFAAGYVLHQMKAHLYGTVLLLFRPLTSPGGVKRMDNVIYTQYTVCTATAIGNRDKEMIGASDKGKITDIKVMTLGEISSINEEVKQHVKSVIDGKTKVWM